MLHHIFKIIWNERRTNAWLVLEYILVFCILWFCSDYIYTMTRSYYDSSGFDIDHTYKIDIGLRPTIVSEENEKDAPPIDKYALAMTFMERVKRYPGVENVSLSDNSMPYSGSSYSGYYIESDSIHHSIRVRRVTSSFFDVFKIKVKQGHIFNWEDAAARNEVLISPFKDNYFGHNFSSNNKIDGTRMPHDISQVHTIYDNYNDEKIAYTVIGTTDKLRDTFFDAYQSTIFHPLNRDQIDLSWNQMVIRVSREADKNFTERFSKDMREQLLIGPYFLASVTSFKDIRTAIADNWGYSDRINSIYAITAFLIINIFLGILGSFWFRTQSRRSEIGLRIALGASKNKVKALVITETVLLLTVASTIGTIICLNFGKADLIHSLGIPVVNRIEWGIGYEQDIINFVLTFGFLAIVSIGAVWYPARKASDIPAAQALREE